MISEAEKFESYLKLDNGHILYLGYLDKDGYGIFHFNNKHTRAHRYRWEKFRGIIPKGLQIDHLCKVRNCVNIDHLEVVTPKENIQRGNTGKYKRTPKEHCRRGHEFTEENTYVYGKMRVCKKCRRVRGQEFDRKPHRMNRHKSRSA